MIKSPETKKYARNDVHLVQAIGKKLHFIYVGRKDTSAYSAACNHR